MQLAKIIWCADKQVADWTIRDIAIQVRNFMGIRIVSAKVGIRHYFCNEKRSCCSWVCSCALAWHFHTWLNVSSMRLWLHCIFMTVEDYTFAGNLITSWIHAIWDTWVLNVSPRVSVCRRYGITSNDIRCYRLCQYWHSFSNDIDQVHCF